jgi:hypothetical protein
MVERAALRFPHLRLYVSNLLTDDLEKNNEYDYIFASGIFTFRTSASYKFVENMVLKMYGLCTKGLAFNSLSAWSLKKNVDEFYADPIKIINLCKKISKRVLFRHDYLPNDFSLYIYK